MKKQKEIVNILIVSLDSKFSETISVAFANDMEMFFLDCRKMIIYDLEDPKAVEEKCGTEYLKKREKKVLKNCADFENTVLSISADLFHENCQVFSKSYIIYIELSQDFVKETIDNIEYKNYNKFFKQNADLIVKSEDENIPNLLEKIKKSLGENL